MLDSKFQFNIGYFFVFYFFCAFLLTPMLFYMAQLFNIETLKTVQDALYTVNNFTVVTQKMVFYSLIIMSVYLLGYLLINKVKSEKYVPSFLRSQWELENIFYAFLLFLVLAILYKLYGIYTGRYDTYQFKYSILGNEKLAYFCSFNIINQLSLVLAALGYFKAKAERNFLWEKRFRVFFYILFIVMLLMTFNIKSRYLTINLLVIVLMVYTLYNDVKLKYIIPVGIILCASVIALKPILIHQSLSSISMENLLLQIVGRVNQSHIVSNIFFYDPNYSIPAGNLAKLYNIIGYENASGVGMTLMGYLYYDNGLTGLIVTVLILAILHKVMYLLYLKKYSFFALTYILLFVFFLNVLEQDIVALYKRLLYVAFFSLCVHITIMPSGILSLFKKLVKSFK